MIMPFRTIQTLQLLTILQMIHTNSNNKSKLFACYHDGVKISIRVYENGDIFCSSSRIEVLNDFIKSDHYKKFENSILKEIRTSSKND